MTPAVLISFEFSDVRIIQRLEPVNKAFKPIAKGFAQYYRVSYQIENLNALPKSIGLGILFDTMIDDNDHCVIAADGKTLGSEWALLQGFGATKPDKMVVGRWPVLHETTWELKPEKVKYGDSAYFLKWENWKLSNAPLNFVTYYGLPRHKKPELRLIVEDHNLVTMKQNVYFLSGKDKVDLNAKMKISEILDNKNIIISGVLLNGYADVTGSEGFNFDLSKRRIENVGKLFKAYGIPYVPKPYGTEQSERTDLNSAYGNVWDRRVEIVVYYKMKEEATLTN
jgi:outer membrane protein OmpA-like peptidoglycan-associated protein